MNDDIAQQIAKLQYHVRLLGETVDYKENPIPALVIEMNWSESDLDKTHDIFEEYDNKLEAHESVNWHAFEARLRDEFGISYQTVKSIIIAFYNNHQWVNVCTEYAKANECIEFHQITRPQRNL